VAVLTTLAFGSRELALKIAAPFYKEAGRRKRGLSLPASKRIVFLFDPDRLAGRALQLKSPGRAGRLSPISNGDVT